MGLVGKMEAEVEMTKSNGEEIFHICCGEKAQHTLNICPELLKKVDLHEGDWETHGSVKEWTYVHEGKMETIKEKMSIDVENRTITATALKGDCLELYNTYNLILHFIPKGETDMVVKITIEYEKKNDDVSPPQKYIDFTVGFIKNLEAQLIKQ
ncbi:hypothetical protein U1Q18_041705 [Sarracenia purpurea var. burkii]